MARRNVTWRRLRSGEALADDVPGLEISTPIRPPNFEADVAVPFLQTLASGLFVGSGLGVAVHYVLDVRWADALGASVAICAALAWLWRLGITTATLQRLESFIGVDLDKDGKVGKASKTIVALNPYQGQQAQRKDERAGQVEVFRRFVEACAIDTSSRRWENALGREQYQLWRDLLIGSGYARWRGRTGHGGWDLTADPATIIAALEGGGLDIN